MSSVTTEKKEDKKVQDDDTKESDVKAKDVEPISLKSRVAAAILVQSFSQGKLAPSYGVSKVNQNYEKKEKDVGFNTIKAVVNKDNSDGTNVPVATREAIKELRKLSGKDQYDLVKQQVEASLGVYFEYQAEEQLKAQQAGLKNELFVASKLFKMFSKRLAVSNDVDIVTYVTETLNNLISKQQDGKTASGRAVGANRAFTAIGDPLITADFQSEMNLTEKGYRNVECDIDKTLLSDDAVKLVESRDLILIEAGSFVGDVCDHYWPEDKYGSLKDETTGKPYKVLPNRGGYKWLSIVGLSSVGAMGFSGCDGKACNVGAIQSAIQSIEMLCVQDGKVVHYQIEPKNGIHSGKEKELLEKGIVLINTEDQTFSDVVTSMGCYGVIVRVFISMEDAYYLTQHREKVNFRNWEKRYNEICSNTNTGGDVYVFEIWGNPYQALGGLLAPKSMVFTWWVKSDGPPASDDDIKENGGAERGSVPLGVMKLTGYVLQILANSGCKEGVAVGLDIGLNETLFGSDDFKENGMTMSYVEAVDFGTPNGMPTQTSGNSFPVADTIKVINGYVDFLNEQSDIEDNPLMITSPYAVRFSKKSYGSVSCAGEYDVTWIEQPVLIVGGSCSCTEQGYETALENANRLLIASREWFQTNTTSKIHWGLYFDESDAMPQEYPWWQYISEANKKSFFDNYKLFNKDGIFKNGFTQRSGLDS